ncbi:class I SAM-dependent methyltransferase [Hyphomicrobium sp.]|uniref:class I SAM-dependent methyltransferase n=1 Tax=Hyphomicrobium sp. TaxID=82 RepID=UPI002D7720D5|nr:class I SAM-dependent methyltransferase [Hyphomicrobium sp.]HET6391009.1 class I SAM-dependent methyltransferase [Hyphomicrobium sp.]
MAGESLNQVVSNLDEEPVTYATVHSVRYAKTLQAIEVLPLSHRGAALEIGYTDVFQYALARRFGFSEVWGTDRDMIGGNVQTRYEDIGGVSANIVKLNLEVDKFPLPDGKFDFILCAEVIEHMDVDPMFPMVEFSRLLAPGGLLFITTPNSTSYAMLAKVVNGYRPHFYMQYQRNRSPYRHNYEHDRHSLEALGRASGFETVNIKTVDVFGGPHAEGLKICEQSGFTKAFRGDCLFYLGRKVSDVIERFPKEVYAPA